LVAKCSACHDDVKVGPLDPPHQTEYECLTCHRKDDPHKNVLGNNCSKCHASEGWKGENLRFNHDTMARFALDQDHRKLACTKCHQNGHWKPLDPKCESCHSKTFLEKKK
jgi:DNA-directed RNA polymerase subunit RPC12/RpoP